MKKLIKTALAVFFAAALTLAFGLTASADDAVEGTVTGSIVNIRASASVNGRWIMCVAKGTAVEVLGEENGWYEIRFGSVKGYMSADYVDAEWPQTEPEQILGETVAESEIPDETVLPEAAPGAEPMAVAESEEAEAEPEEPQTGLVTGSAVRMRQAPNTSSEICVTLLCGTQVEILGETNGWYEVQYGSYEGYMSSAYILAADEESSALGRLIAQTSLKYLGIRYVYGGTTPSTGFDCSGLTQYVYAKCGITLYYRTQQYKNGVKVTYDSLQPGDLVFFDTAGRGSITHVGIYIGDGQFVHAPRPGKTVRVESMEIGSVYYRFFKTARRVV